MRRVFLSAGHTNVKGYDRGARSFHADPSKWVWEGDLAYDLRERIVKILKEKGITVNIDEGKNALIQTLNVFKRYVGEKDIAIDIHFNASVNPKARGTEVLIPGVFSKFEDSMANDLSNAISKIIMTNNRGVKTERESHHQKLGWMRMNCENILIEVCFITSPDDYNWYTQKVDQVAEAIANIIAKYKEQ